MKYINRRIGFFYGIIIGCAISWKQGLFPTANFIAIITLSIFLLIVHSINISKTPSPLTNK